MAINRSMRWRLSNSITVLIVMSVLASAAFGQLNLESSGAATSVGPSDCFHAALQENLGSQVVGKPLEEFMQWLPDLPEDTAAWVLGEVE